ncbi:hypothetical protein DUNSADRAFT_10465 [Dunaliella salina]|uniref:Encoded protein n=1 Tax=Dunaliella salina TaxID=3046 RepID=A0ABQ7GF84_DUNSA|nr:hypothetical protein DUNSADRAFT_10465 [Dunaliella salina]|eukprot:KAF5833265.1 hypothetical protein DUNSADRAFT_10465 [Dunaliella salina]
MDAPGNAAPPPLRTSNRSTAGNKSKENKHQEQMERATKKQKKSASGSGKRRRAQEGEEGEDAGNPATGARVGGAEETDPEAPGVRLSNAGLSTFG